MNRKLGGVVCALAAATSANIAPNALCIWPIILFDFWCSHKTKKVEPVTGSRHQDKMGQGGSKLPRAAMDGDIETVKQLLAEGADPNENPGGYTPVIRAAQGGQPEALRLLLEASGDPNAAIDTHTTKLAKETNALHQAALSGNAECVQLLLEAGADHAVQGGATNVETVLISAAKSGNPDSITHLLAAGANLDLQSGCLKETALMTAARNQHTEAVQTLLDRGANTTLKNFTGATALHIAAETEGGALSVLLAAGLDLEAKDNLERTPLMIAAKKGCLPAAEALLTAGASLAATSKYGETALHIAAQYKCQPEIAEFLVAKGIDERAVDETNKTALQLAVSDECGDEIGPAIARGLASRGEPTDPVVLLRDPAFLTSVLSRLDGVDPADPDILAAAAALTAA
eukprot:m.453570 g.453570  ORF g.453570 m.453570 type:complete len:403 (-) comp20522_c0_seq1:195-1403(-)